MCETREVFGRNASRHEVGAIYRTVARYSVPLPIRISHVAGKIVPSVASKGGGACTLSKKEGRLAKKVP